MCGEVSVGAGGQAGDVRWRTFFAARGTTGGWHAATPEDVRDGWRFTVNPTNNSAADYAACLAAMRRSNEAGPDPARDADILRRCPVEAAVFWGDQEMTCAGHPPAN